MAGRQDAEKLKRLIQLKVDENANNSVMWVGGTTDNGRNYRKAMELALGSDTQKEFIDEEEEEDTVEDYSEEALPCFLHTLQLVVKDLLKEIAESNDKLLHQSLETARSLSITLHQKRDEIEQIKKAEDKGYFLRDCQTRWGSLYDVVKRVVENENLIMELQAGKLIQDCPKMTKSDFTNCKIYLEV